MSTMLIAVILLTLLALFFGVLLGFAALKFKVEGNPIVDELEAILPQTQCGQCGLSVAAPTPKRLPMAIKSTSARPAALRPWKSSPA